MPAGLPSAFLSVTLLLLFGIAMIRPVLADTANFSYTYIYNAPEASDDQRYQYQWRILRQALDDTKATDGPYQMTPSAPMDEIRQAHEIMTDSGRLNVMYMSIRPELERTCIPIRIPVDKNLVGYRVLLIRKADDARFRSVTSLADLKRFSYGLGEGWDDVKVLRANGFKVVTGSNYDGLFRMLSTTRFDVFLRGVNEVENEYDAFRHLSPPLEIEDHLLIYYPMPMYFWFPKSEQGRKLAARVEAGMWRMINDGSYDEIFQQYFGADIARLKLGSRKVFRIDNPLIDSTTLPTDKRLWFDLAER